MWPTIVGAVTIGLPLIIFEAFVLRRQPSAIRSFAIAATLVGVGYLAATGAAGDIGQKVLGFSRDAQLTVRERAAPTPPLPAK